MLERLGIPHGWVAVRGGGERQGVAFVVGEHEARFAATTDSQGRMSEFPSDSSRVTHQKPLRVSAA